MPSLHVFVVLFRDMLPMLPVFAVLLWNISPMQLSCFDPFVCMPGWPGEADRPGRSGMAGRPGRP